MAISNKPFSLPLVIFITIFLLLLYRVNSSDSLSFIFNDFNQDEQDLILQGDAHVSSSNLLQLTKTNGEGVPVSSSTGRALYSTPVHLWDSKNKLASFESNFTFVLTSPSSDSPGDGFTFFIAPPNTSISDGSNGGLLGLFNSTIALNSTTNNQVVAVEFDTYHNNWDPDHIHIGIDVNTIKSSANVSWDRKEGTIGTARINYNASTQNLSVISSYPGSDQEYAVSYVVDLRNVLPKWVRVGFSASTGEQYQVHNIGSWYFNSTLQVINAKNISHVV